MSEWERALNIVCVVVVIIAAVMGIAWLATSRERTDNARMAPGPSVGQF